MIVVETDLQRNLLTVRYSGHVVPSDIDGHMEDVQAALASMAAGFRLLTDLGGVDSMEFSCAPLIKKVMDLINAGGVAVVVRIVPDPKKDIGFRVMSYFHYGPGVNIVTCETVEEAARVLAG